ncbi:peptidylprolyl isomerase [Phreatobacter cathodiphilus]|uniref:Parvulin-like PPIase n=1 Tax=Phreatobacter cathodiphilus TaxID=1868589 RepID=A0A2S0NE47_9HYPH|nr:peptidylprolyl isomerase [Phreatobacter cathodiphilus]AVO46183.1 peptidylprolyl isomerase [Phreatobacter cathodiphilus]
MTVRSLLSLAAMMVALAGPLAAQTPPAATPAPAQPAAPPALPTPADGILARVQGVEIRQADLDAAEEDIGGQTTAQMSPEQKREYLLSFVIDLTLAAKAAEQRNVQEGADFARKMTYYRNKLLVETLLNTETRTRVTEEEMRKIYDEQRSRITPEDEVRARHILVETEDEAKALIAQIRGGADFETIAKEKSKDPGGARNGGDLGFFTKGQMVPEFAEAAFAMQAGQLSQAPVKSQFGWHIIKVEERRQRQIPSFEQVRGQIEDFLTRRVQADLVQKLRSEAQVERFVPSPTRPTAPGAPGTPAPATPRP